MDKIIEFSLDLIVQGNGSSVWCGGESQGSWQITSGTLRGTCIDDPSFPRGIWELQLFGPETRWDHYTDKLIRKEVDEKLKDLIGEKIGGKVKKIGWSEQGMQPDKGWSFDVILNLQRKVNLG